MKIGIIPARLNSTRLPNKSIIAIEGKPMITRVVEQALKAVELDRVIVATDSELIRNRVKQYDIECVITSKEHTSGTDRVAEVASSLSSNDIIINIQGDEPLISPKLLDSFSKMFDNKDIQMGTIASTCLTTNDLQNKDVVKVCVDENFFAKTFTRHIYQGSTLDRVGGLYKHIGVYGFTKNTLLNFSKLEKSSNEITNKLELLRAIDNGISIKVMTTDHDSTSVDTLEDLKKVQDFIKKNSHFSF